MKWLFVACISFLNEIETRVLAGAGHNSARESNNNFTGTGNCGTGLKYTP